MELRMRVAKAAAVFFPHNCWMFHFVPSCYGAKGSHSRYRYWDSGPGTRLPGTVAVHVQMDWAFLSYFKLESDLCESSFWGCQGTLGPKAQRKVVWQDWFDSHRALKSSNIVNIGKEVCIYTVKKGRFHCHCQLNNYCSRYEYFFIWVAEGMVAISYCVLLFTVTERRKNILKSCTFFYVNWKISIWLYNIYD